MSAARSVSRIKPIIVLKSGRSPAGARAAASHTGALAGEDAVYDAAFKRAGIVRIGMALPIALPVAGRVAHPFLMAQFLLGPVIGIGF